MAAGKQHASETLFSIPEQKVCSENSLASVTCLSNTDSEDDDDEDQTRVSGTGTLLNGADPVELDGWGASALQHAGYTLGRFVGGSFATVSVRHVARNADLISFAAKDATGVCVASRRSVYSEYKLLRSLVHPSIVEVKALFTTKHDVWLLREWCHSGCSWSYVAKNGAFEEMSALALVEQLVEGLFYLHQKGLLHRSIEPGNLLLTNNAQTLKIAGFSKLTMLSELAEETSVSDVGEAARRRLQELTTMNSAWVSPEHIQGLAEDSRSDIWSCGLCAGFFIAGRHAFSSPHDTPTQRGDKRSTRSLAKRVSVAMLQGMSFGAKAFVKACLEPNPAKRPWSMELRLHPVLMMRSCAGKADDAINNASGRFQSKTLGDLGPVIEDTPSVNAAVHKMYGPPASAQTMHVLPSISSDEGLLSGCGLLSSGSDMHPGRCNPVIQDPSLSKKVADMQMQKQLSQRKQCYTLNFLPIYSGMESPQIAETRAEVAKAVPSYTTLDTLPPVEVFLHAGGTEGQTPSGHSTRSRRVVNVQEEGETTETTDQSSSRREKTTKGKKRSAYSSAPL